MLVLASGDGLFIKISVEKVGANQINTPSIFILPLFFFPVMKFPISFIVLMYLLLTSLLLFACNPSPQNAHSGQLQISQQDLQETFPISSPPQPSPPSPPSSSPNEEQPEPYRPVSSSVFFQENNLVLEHYWPNDAFLKDDESEILAYNEGSSPIQFISPDMVFYIDEQAFNQYSGTWEKFISRQSWDRTEYINIEPDYYKNEPLVLQPGEKGKLHWHYQFPPGLSGKPAVSIKLQILKDGKTTVIDQRLTKEQVFTVPPKQESGHQEEGQPQQTEGGH